jgi:2-polyprenyl-3-methyl-5-hydroxy-6-metoxy-1,4-benzoquinol methylase
MSKFLKEHCLCCGKITLVKKLSFEMSDVYICKNSCIFSKPKININSLYTPEYFKSNYEVSRVLQENMFDKLSYFLKKYIKSGSILDYGCGTGSFLIRAEKKGFSKNIGIDISKYSTSLAQSRALSSKFYIDTNSLESKKFDCISFIDSIAHIEDINIVFSKLISDNLNEGGVVLIRTPNINKMYFLYASFIGYFVPKKYFSSLLFLPNRLFLFNKKSMNLFLSKHNLEMQEFFTGPEFKKNPSTFLNDNFLKSFIADMVRTWIPAVLNRNNSMTLIAKIKK